jgi:hypothetical protein
MDLSTHKTIELLEHIWEPMAIMGASVITTVKLWWNGRRKIQGRIESLEILAQSVVLKAETVDRTIEDKILPKLEQLRREDMERDQRNQEAHEKMFIAMNRRRHDD